MASPASPSPKDSKPKKHSKHADKKPAAPVEGDRNVSQRIAYLWSASQAALETGNVLLSGFYLNNLIKFTELNNIQVNSDITVCTSCACLLIPGATASVRLVPCESLSNANHAKMLNDRVKSTSIASASGQQLKPVRNGLIFKCKMCGNVVPVAGTHDWKSKKAPKKQKAAPALPITAPAPSSHSAPSKHHSTTNSNTHSTNSSTGHGKDAHAKKVISKEVQAKDDRQKLLASMLKASTQQPAKKPSIVVGGAKNTPPPNSSASAKPAPGKKSLFSFLTSL